MLSFPWHARVQGVGRYAPDPARTVYTPDGIKVPMGPLLNTPPSVRCVRWVGRSVSA